MSYIPNYGKPFRNVPKTHTSFRLREDINNILNKLISETGIIRTDFFETAILEHILRFDIDLKYEGIDFRKYCEVLKFEKLRQYRSKIRANLLSKFLFMNRVRLDIVKLIALERPVKEIKEYLLERQKEIPLYLKNEDLTEEFSNYIKHSENIKKLEVFIKNRIQENNIDKNIEKEVKQLDKQIEKVILK